MGYAKDTKILEEKINFKVKCKCGHSLTIYPIVQKKVCNWCGRLVYRDKKEEFKERLKNENKRVCNNNN